MNNNWASLQDGDTIDIVSVSSIVNKEDLVLVKDFLEQNFNFNFRIKYCTLQHENNLGYSNTVKENISNLISAIEDSSSKAIWCLNGGYGAIRLWRLLSGINIKRQKPKLVIGSGDITFLHMMLYEKLNWPMLHAPVLVDIDKKNRPHGFDINKMNSISKVFDLLLNKTDSTLERIIHSLNVTAIDINDTILGELYGGNIRSIACSIGSDFGLNPDSSIRKIIILEGVEQNINTIDSLFYQIYNSGIFRNVSGVILGDFIIEDLIDDPSLMEKKILHAIMSWGDMLDSLNIPVFRIDNFGRGNISEALPLFTKAKLCIMKDKKILSVEIGSETDI